MATISIVTAIEQDIEYYINDDFTFVITVYKDGSPIDLSGKVLIMQIKENKRSEAYKVQFSTEDGSIVLSGVNNNILTFETTETIKAGDFYQDLENRTDKETIFYGKFTAIQDVTR